MGSPICFWPLRQAYAKRANCSSGATISPLQGRWKSTSPSWAIGSRATSYRAVFVSIDAESFVLVRTDGTWESQATQPSSEWQMHLAIYRDNEAASAIVHTHSDNCVALASLRKALPGFTYVVGFFGGTNVDCIPYNTFGTQALADDEMALGKQLFEIAAACRIKKLEPETALRRYAQSVVDQLEETS